MRGRGDDGVAHGALVDRTFLVGQERIMAQVINGRYTARIDEPFVVFIIGMWLPLHKDPAALDGEMIGARAAGPFHNVFTV